MRRVLETYDLSGRSSLTFDAHDARVASFLAPRMDPFVPVTSDAAIPGVVIQPGVPAMRRFPDIQNPARDGLVTASDGERFFVLADGHACAVPDTLGDPPMRFAYEPG